MRESVTMSDDSSPSLPSLPPVTRQDAPETTTDRTRTIRSEELFAGSRVVLIQHADECYRLMITRNNRLILQK